MDAAEQRAGSAARLPDRIAFLGLGMIGGSIALALRRAGYAGRIAAWTPLGTGPAAARQRGVIDEAAEGAAAALDGAGLVVLAGPPLTILDTLQELASSLRGSLGAKAVITDVASTKVSIVDRAARLGLPFIGGHPMAGRETSGFDAATEDLFDGRPWVVVDPGEMSDAHRVVLGLVHAAGARVISMPAPMHDAAVAAISHMPLVAAVALVESVASDDSPGAQDAALLLAASGWRDMTRLARGDPEMGAGILATNAEAIRTRLFALRETLDRWIVELEGDAPDAARLRARLERARDAMESKGTR